MEHQFGQTAPQISTEVETVAEQLPETTPVALGTTPVRERVATAPETMPMTVSHAEMLADNRRHWDQRAAIPSPQPSEKAGG